MRFYQGTLYASVPNGDGDDRLVALPDDDGDGYPDRTVTILESPEISDVHGFDFHNGKLYLVNHDNGGSLNNIVRYDMSGISVDQSSETVLNSNLPDQGDFYHWTRTLEIRNGYLYVTVGSESNVDPPSGGWYARMTRCDLNGTNCEVYASGLRNSVDFTFHDGQLFATDNGRDDLSDSEPPDEVNIIQQGADYGWPYCYGDNTPDPKYDDPDRCTDTTGTAVNLRAHSVPLGLDFYDDTAFPSEYQGDMYVALHGSYDATPPRGFKVVRIPYDGNQLGEPADFVTGWYQSDGDDDPYEKGDDIKGRPAAVTVGPDGAMYISDDSSGVIYRVKKDNNPPTAAISISPSSPGVGESVTLDGSSSTDSDGTIQQYEWDVDSDGTVDYTGESVTHTYTESGDYTVSLTVTDNNGATATTTETVTVTESNDPPTADISIPTATPHTGSPVSFDGSASTDSDGIIQQYEWDYDGDGTIDGTGATTTYNYSTYGTYSVKLTVTDDDGAVNTTTQTLDVAPAPVCDSCAVPKDPDDDGVYEDVTGDGDVTFIDAYRLYQETLEPSPSLAFDVNGDGDVTFLDAYRLYQETI